MTAKAFPRVDVGKVNLNHFRIGAFDRIPKGDRCMRISASVQDDWLTGKTGVLHPGDEIAFMIALPEMQREPARFAGGGKASGRLWASSTEPLSVCTN